MSDQSFLDRKYFIDDSVYNCPFCNRNNVVYKLVGFDSFDWNNNKTCFVYMVKCSSCNKKSMHLSFEDLRLTTEHTIYNSLFTKDVDIDSRIFYSVPTSFFILDNRINSVIRELITEAEGCLKMNFLTGASACMRKAIYELLIIENVTGEYYEDKIKALKKKYPASDPDLFDILYHIQEMTSDKIHEQSWDKWDSNNLLLIIETLKTVLYDIFVSPKEKEERSNKIKALLDKSKNNK